ncbi:MAG: histidine phosphatase family protein [Flavobacteriales bacterium]|nr:histidine phosphatase family protein [Flavobacteriales bacterium]
MKTLYLIRHAKSDWENPSLSDFDRPLNSRGIRNAPFMAQKLIELNFNPGLIVCSPAQRTTTTAELISKNTSILFEKSIYEASLNDLIHLINFLPKEHEEIAIIGHNPSITNLSNYLTDDFIDNMPTCSIVKIELEIDNWNEIIKGIGMKKYFIYPKGF